MIEIECWNLEPNSKRLVSIHLHNSLGVTVLTTENNNSACLVPDPWYEKEYSIEISKHHVLYLKTF